MYIVYAISVRFAGISDILLLYKHIYTYKFIYFVYFYSLFILYHCVICTTEQIEILWFSCQDHKAIVAWHPDTEYKKHTYKKSDQLRKFPLHVLNFLTPTPRGARTIFCGHRQFFF